MAGLVLLLWKCFAKMLSVTVVVNLVKSNRLVSKLKIEKCLKLMHWCLPMCYRGSLTKQKIDVGNYSKNYKMAYAFPKYIISLIVHASHDICFEQMW